MPKATDHHTPTGFTRRALAVGGGAAAAIGITAGAAASAAGRVSQVETPSSDAELIGLCRQYDALERRYQDTCCSAKTIEQEHRISPELDAIKELQAPVLARICALPVATIGGAAALCASFYLWDGELYIEEDDPHANAGDRLLATLLRGLVGRA